MALGFWFFLCGLPAAAFAAEANAAVEASAAAAAKGGGSFIDAARKEDPALLKERIAERLQGPAPAFIQELYAKDPYDRKDIFYELAGARSHKKEFAQIMKGLIALVDPSEPFDVSIILPPILPSPSRPPPWRHLLEDSGAFKDPNVLFWSQGLLYDPVKEERAMLQELYENTSALEFFQYIHYTSEGEALWKDLIKDHLHKRKGKPLFVSATTDSAVDLLTYAEARGNLEASKALRETRWFSDRNTPEFIFGALGGLAGFGASLAFISMGGLDHLIDNYGAALGALGMAGGVGLCGLGFAAACKCYTMFRDMQIKINAGGGFYDWP